MNISPERIGIIDSLEYPPRAGGSVCREGTSGARRGKKCAEMTGIIALRERESGIV
jgi:hypothetical protein